MFSDRVHARLEELQVVKGRRRIFVKVTLAGLVVDDRVATLRSLNDQVNSPVERDAIDLCTRPLFLCDDLCPLRAVIESKEVINACVNALLNERAATLLGEVAKRMLDGVLEVLERVRVNDAALDVTSG